jgi:hypothetical protein
MKKLIIFLAVIIASMFLLASCGKEYKVIVDYNLSFDEMLEAGKYDSIDKKVNANTYPVPHEKRGIKVFRKNECFPSNQVDTLQPKEIDSLLVVMSVLESKKWQEYRKKYGSITLADLNAGKFDDLKLKRCTVQYKKPDIDTLTMRLFKTKKSMEEAGFRPPTFHEAITFRAKYPKVQNKFNIFANIISFERKKVEGGGIPLFPIYFGSCVLETTTYIVLTSDRKIKIAEITIKTEQEPGLPYLDYQNGPYPSLNNGSSDRFLGVLIKDGRTK